jgi:hypothetical protein
MRQDKDCESERRSGIDANDGVKCELEMARSYITGEWSCTAAVLLPLGIIVYR